MKGKLLLVIAALFTTSAFSQNLSLIGHLGYNGSCAGVWHYVDSLNNEYAIIGVSDRVSIADVTNPTAPVEVFSVPALSGQNSLWREVKTSKNHAYAVSEGGGGLIIINLSHLPDSISSTRWYGDSIIAGQLQSAHTLATSGDYLYIFGSNINSGGCIIADISDPWNPHFVGQYESNYVHDGYIRNDTLWAGEIYAGQFSVIDVSNKANPVLLETQQTPGQFCHNVWLSDDSKYAFTTDEVGGAPLGSFDVSDISNISLKYAYFTDSLPNEEVHNVRVLNDFLINPSYGSQITLVDASRPDNLIEIARAPTDFNSGSSFLCWDASPYLPSGNIIATDVSGGLLIFQPNYQRACYLEGNVTDSITGAAMNNVLVEIVSTPKTAVTGLTGNYKTGIADAGSYTISFSKAGYITKTFPATALANGQLTQLDVQLVPFLISGQVIDITNSNPIAGISVSASNGTTAQNITTDSSGNFTFTNLNFGLYTISAGAWGYVTECITQFFDGTPVTLELSAGYMDDFSTDNGWQVTGSVITGEWVRDIPIGTSYLSGLANPGDDVADDCSDLCFITGNGGGNSSTDDVDNGTTILTSPLFDLTSYVDPYVNFSRWFFINPNVAANNIDTLFIYISNGTSTVLIDSATLNSIGNGSWINKSVKVSDFVSPSSTMTIIIEASDKPGTGNVVEAGIDNFIVSEGPLSVSSIAGFDEMLVYPNPFTQIIRLQVDAKTLTPASRIVITDVAGRTLFRSLWKEEIDLHALSIGVYIISIENTKTPVSPVRLLKN